MQNLPMISKFRIRDIQCAATRAAADALILKRLNKSGGQHHEPINDGMLINNDMIAAIRDCLGSGSFLLNVPFKMESSFLFVNFDSSIVSFKRLNKL